MNCQYYFSDAVLINNFVEFIFVDRKLKSGGTSVGSAWFAQCSSEHVIEAEKKRNVKSTLTAGIQ